MESFGGPTMGSTYSIKYVRHAGLPAPAEVRVEVEKILTEVDRQLSTYRSDSDIERFNVLPANRCQSNARRDPRTGPRRRDSCQSKAKAHSI
jgi:thiamine biosynthesis lipoprotein